MTQEAPARPDTAFSLLFGAGAPGDDDLPRRLEEQLGGGLAIEDQRLLPARECAAAATPRAAAPG